MHQNILSSILISMFFRTITLHVSSHSRTHWTHSSQILLNRILNKKNHINVFVQALLLEHWTFSHDSNTFGSIISKQNIKTTFKSSGLTILINILLILLDLYQNNNKNSNNNWNNVPNCIADFVFFSSYHGTDVCIRCFAHSC